MAADREKFPLPERLFPGLHRGITLGLQRLDHEPGRREQPTGLREPVRPVQGPPLSPDDAADADLHDADDAGAARQSFRYGASVGTTAVGITRSQLVEEVRVRVHCQGWRLERHEPTGLTLRGGQEVATWSEDLTFARAAGAVTPASGGLPASRCPSCGAHLDLDPGGACRYCHGVVTAGNYDWVLVSWQREPW